MLLNGNTPDGTGAHLEADDDSGFRTDSRISAEFLEAGTYTIEATTYSAYFDHSPQRSTGDYTLIVAVDYTPRATGQPEKLSVRAGAASGETWGYEPDAASAAITSTRPDWLTASLFSSNGVARLNAASSRVGTHTVTVTYTNGPGTLSQNTTILAFDGSCPPSPGGHRARQIHHHANGNGHLGCQAHKPIACEAGLTSWTPSGGGHAPRDLKGCNWKNNSGIIDPEYLPWSPYDVDGNGNPVLCDDGDAWGLQDPGDILAECMRVHNLDVVTWSSGFDMDTWIAEYTAETGRSVSAELRRDLEAIQTAVDHQETILVGTEDYARPIGDKRLDDAIVQLICGEVVEFGVERGVDAAAKRVGGWAQNRFPTGRVLSGALKLSTVLSFAQTALGVLWTNFGTDAACD